MLNLNEHLVARENHHHTRPMTLGFQHVNFSSEKKTMGIPFRRSGVWIPNGCCIFMFPSEAEEIQIPQGSLT